MGCHQVMGERRTDQHRGKGQDMMASPELECMLGSMFILNSKRPWVCCFNNSKSFTYMYDVGKTIASGYHPVTPVLI